MGPNAEMLGGDPKRQRVILMDNWAINRDTLGERRHWSDQARVAWKAWRNYYPSLAYARGDPHTFLVPIDRAAHMAGLTQHTFYCRYLANNRLPYEVKTWFHGRKMRRKSFVPRNALLELLARELCEAARLHMARRGRPLAIPRNAGAADLERLLDRRLPKLD